MDGEPASDAEETRLRGMDAGARALRSGTVAVAGLSALVAAAAVLIATSKWPGVSPDSVWYLSTGLNLAEGEGLRAFHGGSVTVFPPGMPVVVAVGHWIGLTPEWTVRLFNAAMSAAAVCLGFVLLRRHVRSRALVAGATALLAVSIPLLEVAQPAWTEPAFIVVCLAFVLVLERLPTEGPVVSRITGAVGLVWLGFLLRYVGIVLIMTGAFAVLVGLRKRGWRAATLYAMAFTAGSAALPAAWMLRNYVLDGKPMGSRSRSVDGLGVTPTRYLETLGSWVLPRTVNQRGLVLTAGIAVGLVSAGVLAWSLWDRRRSSQRPRPELTSDCSRVPLVTFACIYTAYLVLAQLTTKMDPIDTRLMSPLYVPFVVLGAMGVERIAELVPVRARRVVLPVGGVLLAAFLLGQSSAFVLQTSDWAREGRYYASESWRSTGVIEAAAAVPPDAQIYSNVPEGLWAVLRREPTRWSPGKGGHRSDMAVSVPKSFLQDIACHESYLIWFEASQSGSLLTPDELREFVNLSEVSSSADGTVYRIDPLGASATPCQ